MSHADDIFIRNFLAILGALVVFTIFAIFLGRVIGGAVWERMQSAEDVTEQRIGPVAAVRVGEAGQQAPAPEQETQVAAAAEQPAAEGAGKSGEEVYNSACVACHAAGVAGAPKLDDEAAWKPRVEKGLDTLVSHAINGFNAMPPKGGNPSLSDAEVERAVEYMLAQTGFEVPGAGAAEAGAPQSGAAAEAAQATAQETQPASGEQMVAQAEQGDAAAGKKVYNSSCVACHAAGVAGAPKLDDKAAWQARAEKGMGTLLNHAVNGFNAMPPKGGNMSLSEADVRNAIQYMLDEAGVSAQ